MGDLKATPPPWSFDGPSHSIIVWGPEAEQRVCFMTSDGPARPNACLISAAPELYEAALPFEAKLNEAIDSFGAAEHALGGPLTDDDAVTVTIGQLRALAAALAKARGEHPQSIREGVDRD